MLVSEFEFYYIGILTKRSRTFSRIVIYNNDKEYRVSKDMILSLKSFNSEQLIMVNFELYIVFSTPGRH